ADELTPIRKRDRLEEPSAIGVDHTPAAIEELVEFGRERVADERLPVRGECVLLDLMDEDHCQRPVLVAIVDLEATQGRVNADRKRTHVSQDAAKGEPCKLSPRRPVA